MKGELTGGLSLSGVVWIPANGLFRTRYIRVAPPHVCVHDQGSPAGTIAPPQGSPTSCFWSRQRHLPSHLCGAPWYRQVSFFVACLGNSQRLDRIAAFIGLFGIATFPSSAWISHPSNIVKVGQLCPNNSLPQPGVTALFLTETLPNVISGAGNVAAETRRGVRWS